jgi:Xaa-Pro aminopeptidase
MTPLMNRKRAETALAALDLAGLVLTEPVNIYHATGFWPVTGEMGHVGATIALVSADPAAPPALITSQFLHYFQHVGAICDSGVDIFLYTSADKDDPDHAGPPAFYRAGNTTQTDTAERLSRAATERALHRHGAFASATAALAAALAGSQLARGTVGIDHAAAGELLAATGSACTTRAAEPALRRIRHIKSPAEIEMMRKAASLNCAAARAAIASVRIGDSYADLRRAYFTQTGARGGRPGFLQIDSTAQEHHDGFIRAGRAFMIDAVSSYDRYHGDYGRTVFAGAPDAALLRCIEAAVLASAAVRAALRPGLLYSDISRIGQDAVANAGYDVRLIVSPHSVGLLHTDEPFLDDRICFAKADHLIEAGMVLSVDCPVIDTDIGGTVHLEDLWLVTEEGCEPLNDSADPLLMIPN